MLSWLQLLRLPTVFTAIADVLCGFLIAATLNSPRFPEWSALPWLILASTGLYLGGMVLNDVFDSKLDAEERPERPIPSGRIPRRRASLVGYALILGGLGSGILAWSVAGHKGHTPSIVGGIALAVLAYNTYLKKTWAGPLGMAACRFLNLALGASTAVNSTGLVLSWQQPVLGAATGLAVYVAGVTWIARNEADSTTGIGLDSGLAVAVIGIIVSGISTLFAQLHGGTAGLGLVQYLLLTGVTIARGVAAIRDPQPARLQSTVGKMLLWIIVLDAVTVYTVTGNLLQEFIVLSLVIPVLLLRSRIPMS